ncbi:MAG: TolC family protein [Spirochaetes bacterium]|nr:TolC family protein [Spirochaetota bacterium]
MSVQAPRPRRLAYRSFFLLTLVAGFAIANPVFPQETGADSPLSVTSIVPRVLEHDSAYRQAQLDAASAAASRALARAQLLPQVTLGSSPNASTYSWSRQESQRIVETEAEDFTRDVHSASAQLNLTQALPTDGNLSVYAGNTFRAQDDDGEDPLYRQDVSVGATWQQPLFTNRRIVDLRVLGASIELAGGIPLRLAQTSADIQKNARILSVMDTYIQVVELRKQIDVLGTNIETTQERVEQARLRRRQGTATQRDVWDIEISLEELRERRLEAEYALRQAESSLAASLGIDAEPANRRMADRRLSDAVPEISLPPEEEIIEVARAASLQIARARENVNQRRLQRIVNGRQYAATLRTSVTLAPQYDPEWVETGTFGSTEIGESYSELFADEASWNTTLSVDLTVPLYNGSQARHQAQQDQRSIDKAEVSLRDAQRSVAESIHALYLRRQLLRDQLSLRRSSLTLERDRLAEKEKLAELDSATELELTEARTQVASKENALWRTRADLFLNALRILESAGRDLESTIDATAESGVQNP